MSDLEQKKAVAREFVDAMAKADKERFAACFTADAILETVGTMAASGRKSVSKVKNELDGLKALFPNGMILKIESITGEADRVIVELRGFNTTNEGLDYPNRYVFILEFAGSKIRELREYQDTALVERVIMPSFARLQVYQKSH